MTRHCIMKESQEALEGRPGQPIVLGVCQAIAQKMGWEVWCVRLATIISILFVTMPTLAAYIIAGFALKETETRTRGFFAGLAVMAREWMTKITDALGRIFGSEKSSYGRY